MKPVALVDLLGNMSADTRRRNEARLRELGRPTAPARETCPPPGRPASRRATEPARSARDLLLELIGPPHALPSLKGEDRLQAELVWRTDRLVREEGWSVLLVAFANETRVPVPSARRVAADPGLAAYAQRQKRVALATGSRLKAMGLRPGVTDLVALAPDKVGFVELKFGKNKLSPAQEAFRGLAAAWRLPWVEARRWEDLATAYRLWGMTPPGR